MPEWVEQWAALLVAGGLLTVAGQALIAWWGRRKVAADAQKSRAEAAQAEANAIKTMAEASQLTSEQLIGKLQQIDSLTKANEAIAIQVEAQRVQQATNMATIAALNAQNAQTLRMNNDLLIANSAMQQRIGQLENELNAERARVSQLGSDLTTEREAKTLLEQKVKNLEARIAELEARQPSNQ